MANKHAGNQYKKSSTEFNFDIHGYTSSFPYSGHATRKKTKGKKKKQPPPSEHDTMTE
jgi:hypothetical protein